MPKILRKSYFLSSNFIYALPALLMFLAVFGVMKISAQSFTGGSIVESFLKNETNQIINSISPFDLSPISTVAGGLDLDYEAGVQNPNFMGSQDGRVRAIVIQPDGKHIIAGNFETADSTGRSSIARFNADGTLDESFDTGVGIRGQSILDLALQPDGKIIVGGAFVGFTNSSGLFQRNYILRLNSDGSLDETFNPGQSVNGWVKTVILQPDGKILIGGDFTTVGVSRRGIARLNSDGSLDTSLNPGTGITGTFEAMTLQTDGKIVIGGALITNYNGTAVNNLFRIDANGALDPSFNIGTGPTSGYVYSLKVQRDGKILVGGSFTAFNGQVAKWIVRLNSDGSRDSFVEGSGACPATCTLPSQPQQFSVLANGQIYISSAGTSNNAFPAPTAWGGALLRYNADGTRDTSFNPPAETVASPLLPFNRHAVQADGSVIGTHGRFLSGTPDFAYSHVRRLTPAGNLDASYTPLFGDIVGPSSLGSFVADVALQADGKLLAAGNFSAANNQLRRDIARFNADGSLDTSFNFLSPAQTIFKVLPLPDGKILACGAVSLYSNPPEPTRYGVVRLNSNGSVDTTFVGTGAFGGNTAVYDAALQPDGKIVIVGRFNTYNGVAREGIARLHPDGSLDTSFNPGTGFGQASGSAEPRELKILPDGKIVVVGVFSTYNGTPRVGLVRILSDGALDTSFTPTGTQAASYVAVANLPNGQLLIGSSVLQRINTDGSVDTSFTGIPQIVSGGNIEHIHVLGNGQIMIGGTFETAAPRRSGVARVLPNGGFDTSFGNNLRGADVAITGFGDIAVDEANNHIYFGGTFYSFNNIGRGSLARVFLNTATVAVTVSANPAGRSFTVDGTNYTSPQTFNWEPGSQHTIATTSPQAGTAGTQYTWANWSDGGAISHTVTTPNADTTYTANFTTQYQLTMTSAAGGTVNPSSGFYNAGQTVQISATPNSGAIFTGWTGTGDGSYSGTNNPAMVTMNGPLSQIANFVQCSYTLSPSGATVSATDGNASFAVAAPAGCVWTAASNAAWLTATSAGSGNGTVNYAFSANAGAARTAAITVSGQSFTVNQIAADGLNDQPILFTSNRDGNVEIYKMNADGTNQQRLTNSPESEGSALWSPDGSKIAFTRNVSASQIQIWVMNAGGGNQTLISDAANAHALHGWSPNGQKILFGKKESSSVENLWTMNPDGSNKVQITNAGTIDHIADWSRDGSRIAFGRCTPQFVCDVFTINADGSNPTNLTPTNANDDDGAKWTPDGRIVYGSQTAPDNYNVYIMNADGTNKLPLTNAAPAIAYSPNQVSPAGDKVSMAYRGASPGTFEIATVKLDGTGLVNLTNNSSFDFWGAWSPDGLRIAFRSRRDTATDEVYVMNADGSGVARLTFNSATDTVTDWLRLSRSRAVPFDLDGDGKTDVGVYRPNGSFGGEWWYLRSSDGVGRAFGFGASTDSISPADFTGDGKTDIAVFRPSTGFWYVMRSEDNTFYGFPFGAAGDVPVPADFDADGKADAAVFRAGTWFISLSSGGSRIESFGAASDMPVAADYDGDGKADPAVFRPSGASGAGEWWLNMSTQGVRAVSFGAAGDKAVPADYTGDGKTDVAVFRPSTGFWYILRSEDLTFYGFPFGVAGDVPSSGDYDGDGKADPAVFRAGTWYINRSTAGQTVIGFGTAGDVPVPSAFVR